MVVSRSVKHVVTCLQCVSFCVRSDIQPFGKCPFCSSPRSELPCLPLPAHGGCSTDSQAGFQQQELCARSQELGCGSRPNSSETISPCSLVHRFGAVLCSQLQPVSRFPSRGAPRALWDSRAVRPAAPRIVLELWKPAVTDLRQTATVSALSARVVLL